MSGFLSTTYGVVLTAFLGILGKILYDRFKSPTPNYDFKFEEQVPYYSAAVVIGDYSGSGHLKNYIRIENCSAIQLSNVSTKTCLDTRKERQDYQRIGLRENLFDLEIECLLEDPTDSNQQDFLTIGSREEICREKMKQGFFIADSDVEKLKCISPIKIKVEYKWGGKKDSDVWLFDFLEENKVGFSRLSPTFWQNIKRRLL